MPAATEIHVYASFPSAVALGSDLNLDTDNWKWVLCLTIPLETLNALQFSHMPYKWIRYAIGVVVGAEGDLSYSSDPVNIVDYNACLPAESFSLYYHTSDDERRRMFPVDPNTARTTVTSRLSVATTRRAQFHSEVAERDGHKCVVTGMEEEICDAVHLLAHSKGDVYISTYTNRRKRGHTREDLVEDIDSVSNGVLLNVMTHRLLGKQVAFLPTPNFAMNTTDVDPTAITEEKRCTAHIFEPGKTLYLGGLGAPPSGSPLHISDSRDWPPDILFDAVYAGAVLHNFGTQTLKDEVAATWKDTFYPGGVVRQPHRPLTAEEAQQKEQEREARQHAHAVPDTFDMLMALPYISVPRGEVQAMLKEGGEKAQAAEHRRLQEKVDAWNRDIIL